MTTTQSPHEIVAATVRAELARRKIQAGLVGVLHMSEAGVSRRLRGETPFDINELYAVSEFLGVPLAQLVPTAGAAA